MSSMLHWTDVSLGDFELQMGFEIAPELDEGVSIQVLQHNGVDFPLDGVPDDILADFQLCARIQLEHDERAAWNEHEQAVIESCRNRTYWHN